MTDQSQNSAESAAAFQKIWLESMSKLMQAAFTFSPESAPPELLREIRSGILQALAGSWNEFLRSPQFQQGTKQWMDNAIAFRKLSGDFMAKVRKEMQAPSRDDIDTVLLTVRHLETRLLDRLEELSKRVEALDGKSGPAGTARPGARTAVRRPVARKVSRRRKAGKNKQTGKP